MNRKNRQLVIIGDSAFAQIAYHYFSDDGGYDVAAFCVEKDYIKTEKFFDIPVISFDQLTKFYPPESNDIFVAITYGNLNRLRTRFVNEVQKLGYSPASYVSPHAYISKQAKLGEHCFVFENNVIQPFTQIGNNVILWSGNHIGHHSNIGDNCFISSHVVISGYVNVGQSCFFGVNSTVVNNINIGDDCWIGPSVTISQDAKAGSLFPPVEAHLSSISTHKFFKLKELSNV
jgi:sugar O-acyltransferase (sialic acid O-acetyltransferase NeuD family)